MLESNRRWHPPPEERKGTRRRKGGGKVGGREGKAEGDKEDEKVDKPVEGGGKEERVRKRINRKGLMLACACVLCGPPAY